jgi:hypothetical protein
MKISKEDIQKYGTEEEKVFLEGYTITADSQYLIQSKSEQIEKLLQFVEANSKKIREIVDAAKFHGVFPEKSIVKIQDIKSIIDNYLSNIVRIIMRGD